VNRQTPDGVGFYVSRKAEDYAVFSITWTTFTYWSHAVSARSEPQACNGFPIRSFPQRVFLHSLLGEKKKPDPLPLIDPSHRFGSGVFSFQTPRELIHALESMGFTVAGSRSLDAERFYMPARSSIKNRHLAHR